MKIKFCKVLFQNIDPVTNLILISAFFIHFVYMSSRCYVGYLLVLLILTPVGLRKKDMHVEQPVFTLLCQYMQIMSYRVMKQ